jgi:hypothetical protein
MPDREADQQRADDEPEAPVRKNPPLVPDAGMGDGGISASGGVSGGARGHGGTSDRGAGSPRCGSESGPGEYKATSRFDYDRRDVDAGEGTSTEDSAENDRGAD